jgi:predicted nucleic-acid-binding protein
MLAVDTNLVVRYLTLDHREQSPLAKALIDNNEIWVATTVLLETEWVLRSVYGYAAAPVAAAFRAFSQLPTVTVQDALWLHQALDWMEQGMDFAEALHLSAAANCDAFVTFDRGLIRAAARNGGVEVRTP